MYHSVTFGDKNTWDDWRLVPASRPVFNPPAQKVKTLEIPGGDGVIDLSQSLTGYPVYQNRTGSIEFIVMNDFKRSSIISFASYCVCPDNPVTREQFKRVFRIYAEYEEIIKDNGLQNGEVDIAIRIIREAYENNLRNRSFVEDVRGYGGE